MALFKDTDDLASVFPMLQSAAWEHLQPFIELVELEMFRTVILGPTLYDALHAAYQASITVSPTPVPSPLDALLPKVRKPLAFLATKEAMTTLSAQFTGGGLVVTKTQNVERAPMWMANKSITSIQQQAFGWLNQLIMHLLANESSLSSWSEAPLRKEVRESLLPDMRAVEPFLKLHGPWMLHQLRPYLREVQTGPVKDMLGSSAYATLLAHVHANPSTVTSDEQAQLDLIRPAMLHLAIADAITPLSITMDNMGVWVWTIPSSGGGISGGQKPAEDSRSVGLKRDHHNKGLLYLEKLRDLITPSSGNVNTLPGNTGSVFFGG